MPPGALARRMRRAGWRWYPQTVSEAEAGRRAIRAEELLGLAVALETTPWALMAAPRDLAAVALPSGDQIPAQRISVIDDSVTWDDDELRVSLAAAARTAARDEVAYLDELVRERREPGMTEVRQQLAAIKEQLAALSRDNGKET